jgi:AcrR family transcriptional regulator
LLKISMTPKRSYHHGNLRKVLLDAGVALIGEVGPKGFTIREVARRAGVSHNAPYRHFQDKDELLAVIAAEGFDRLALAMKKHAAAGVTAVDRLRSCGCGYVDFALRWPQHFLVMFDLPSVPGEQSRHEVAGRNAFQTLLEFIVESQKAAALPRRDPLPLALMAWSMVHGIAKLATSGNLPYTSRQTLDFTRCASEAFISGMRDLKMSGTRLRVNPARPLREQGTKIRIISARDMSKRERKAYEQNSKTKGG